MLDKIIGFSIVHRYVVLMVCVGVVILGCINFTKLPIDAVPDITNIQVQVNTQALGYSPLEVEQRITFPLETVMAGLPNLEQTRSLSRYGLSQITIIFKDGTDIYFARQLINERLQEAKGNLPAGIEPNMGPIATGLGEIYMWTVETEDAATNEEGNPYTLSDLRTVQDWVIKPQLRNVKGVTEINSLGGFERQYHVNPYPDRLMTYGLTFHDVLEALHKNNNNVGAGFIEKAGEQYLVRVPGQVESSADILMMIVAFHHGVPVFMKDVAEVIEGQQLRTGAATKNGKEVVLGTVFMLMGENSRVVSVAVDKKIAAINQTLPPGVQINTVYNRTHLVDATIATVKENLLFGALLVIVVLFLLLGNIRAAIITAAVIPLSMLLTISGMVANKVSANLMSLGALDFGIIIDGAVVMVENCTRRMALLQKQLGRPLHAQERFDTVLKASKEVQKTILFGQLIIMIVYLPILTLTGVEGKMFTPMALTVVMALVGAMIFSVTFIPAAVAIFLRGKIKEEDNRIIQTIKTVYAPLLQWAMEHQKTIAILTLGIFAATALMAMRMGQEFIPRLDEGDIAMHAMRIPSTSLTQAIKMQHTVEEEVKKHPQVDQVFSKIGTAEIATDPMPPNVADTMIMLKPRSQWPNPHQTKEEVVAEIESAVKKIPGNAYEFTQPIEMRFNELISGVRSDVAVKVFGDDMEVLLKTGQLIAQAMMKIKGAKDVKVEQISGLPVLTVDIDRKQAAQFGLTITDIQDVIEVAVGGKLGGQVFEGDKRFDLVVRLPDAMRHDIRALENLPLKRRADPKAPFVPLGQVAKFELTQGPSQISRENGKRNIVVTANVRGRDLGLFVKEAQNVLNTRVKIPSGYWITWGGQYEQMLSATYRLMVVVPVALLLIMVLLFVTLGSLKDALLVFSAIPLALTGGVLALFLRDIPFSISAGIGFIALSGVAVLNGLVLITFIKMLRTQGKSLGEAIVEGALTRFRPVVMTALVAALGFVPMALAVGTGAEVQRPLATVVIGGIVSSTLLTLLILPVLYQFFHRETSK